ncbi:DNA polymerase IV [Pseudonocardia abyssalis]|uniref:DNA polymerase IV n=1 Tax=Pseudonocardia abyssalis TaxID=2792008 RepID=A0ABS6UP45_9PSEU|nr:DNA polymerase IV [Pseudonocardia abyssalis]MBW0118521.1 DNA polymerase IV [Pseudonocardia abyssalis]MBW0133992.1 DNA polymerase IV [Pseudonocardia abyssalis]
MAAPWVLHVDLDQFIAAVEVLRRPGLVGLPVVVGGRGDPTERGVVATASYAAREHGIRSGMPLRTAVKRCPDAVFLPADNPAYDVASAGVMDALRALPGVVVEVMGWDEAFLGVDTDDPEAFAAHVQAQVYAATSLRCTVGIGDNLLRAKIATGFGKPAGVFRLTRGNWFAVMGDRPTRALWGVGVKTARKLADRGLHTVADLAAADPAALAADLGPARGPYHVQLGRGIGRERVDGTPWVPRSHGRETTFQADLEDWADVRTEVAGLARTVAGELAGRPARRVGVTVRFVPFTTRTRSATLPAPTLDADVLAAAAAGVLDRFPTRRAVRLVGVRAEF